MGEREPLPIPSVFILVDPQGMTVTETLSEGDGERTSTLTNTVTDLGTGVLPLRFTV